MRWRLGFLAVCVVVTALIAAAMPDEAIAQEGLISRMILDQCASREAVLESLGHENQYILVAADFVVPDGNSGRPVALKFAFTANVDFSRGYQIYSNMKGELCKGKQFYGVKLFDGRRQTVDRGAYFQPADQAPQGSLNQVINSSFQNARQVPFYQATSSDGETFTVTGQHVERGSGGFIISDRFGVAHSGGSLNNIRYTDTATSTLDNLR